VSPSDRSTTSTPQGRVCELLGVGRGRFVVMTKDTQTNDGTDASVLSKSLCRAACEDPDA
jgi:hypothetical protein